jgi:subtilisin family serine protease
MLRFQLNRRVPDSDWRPAGLTVLDSSDKHAAVVFAARSDLERFKRRLAEYAQGPRERPPDQPARDDQDPELAAHYEVFFDAIEEFRPLEPLDRISPRLSELLAQQPNVEHVFDVEMWFHSDAGVREDWLDELRARTAALDGAWIDHYVGERAAVVLARLRGNRAVAEGVAELDQICLLDLVPQPRLEPEELAELQDIQRLPDTVPDPPDDAPVVGIIDTGIRAGHPLLRPAVVDAAAPDAAFSGQGEDAHGHGTAVAGITLYGDLLDAARRRQFEPRFWLASVRVLDDNGNPPLHRSWIGLIAEAIEYLADELGCRIINLSFGVANSPYVGGKSTPLAAELDTLARRYRLLLVVSAGNIDHATLIPAAQLLADWPRYLTDDGHEIIDPAQSALALTVGAIAERDGVTSPTAGTTLGRKAVAAVPGPAPYTRRGPGVMQAIKPELVANGGNWVYDQATGERIRDPAVEVVSTSGAYPQRLFGSAAGTSLAAPFITHLAGRLSTTYPDLSANALRALLAQAAVNDPSLVAQFEAFEADQRERLCQELCGFGVPTWELAGRSTDNRVVLYAEDSVRPDDFHVYRIPITECFTDVKGPRALTIALAFDPPVRHRRFDYLAYHMEFLVVRGIDLANVFEMAAAGIEDPEAGALADYEVKMRPTRTVRSRGTCQVGYESWSRRPNKAFRDDWYLVVRSLNKWLDTDAPPQPYTVTATIEVEQATELYAELEAEVRIELEDQLRATV